MQFLIAHWRGELTLTKSFLLNFAVGYIVVVLLLVLTGDLLRFGGEGSAPAKLHLYAGSIVYFCWFVWAVVGVARCSSKIYQDASSTLIRKCYAAIAFVAVAVVVAVSVNDLRMLFL